jgi:hypothetical protein
MTEKWSQPGMMWWWVKPGEATRASVEKDTSEEEVVLLKLCCVTPMGPGLIFHLVVELVT